MNHNEKDNDTSLIDPNGGNFSYSLKKFILYLLGFYKTSPEKKALGNKKWYRAITVFYILAFLGTLTGIIYDSIENRFPRKTIDQNLSTIVCDSGGQASLNNIGISISPGQTKLDYYDDAYVRTKCQSVQVSNTELSFSNKIRNIAPGTYSFYPIYTRQSYYSNTIEGWALSLLGSIALSLVIFRIIQIIFFYIVIGEKPNPYRS